MKKFRVGVWEEKGGYAIIKAKDEKEATHKAQQYIDDYGIDDTIETTHRNTEILDVEEVKK